MQNCKGNLGKKTVLCSKLSHYEITEASLWGFMVNFQVHLLLTGAGSLWCNQVFFLLQLGPRQTLAPEGFSLLFWQVPPHPLALPDASVCAAGDGIWCAGAQKEKPSALPRCANPLWQPTSPAVTSDGRAWQGQWLLCHRGYLCSLKSPTSTQEGPSLSFSAIKCFLLRNLHNLRAIFSPHNQAPLKPFSHSRASI